MAVDRPDEARLSGSATDGIPWEKPRGPHLPDAIAHQPVLVWPFLALAALLLARDVSEAARLPSLSAEVVIRDLLAAIPAVATALLGAAWFRRHPQRSLGSPMTAAVTLLAVASAMRLAAPWVVATATSLVASGDDPFASIRWSSAWSAVEGAIVILANVGFIVAFRDARRRTADPRERTATIVVAAIAILTIILEVGTAWSALASTADSDFANSPSGWLFSLVSVVATAAVAALLLGGAIAGEAPPIAWRLGAIGLLVQLGSTTVVMLATTFGPLTQALFEPFQWTLVVLEAIGALALLAAIVLGLPEDEPAPPGPVAVRG